MSEMRVDSAASGADFDPAAEEEWRRLRVRDLQARIGSSTNYAGHGADEAELRKLEADQAARRDLSAGRASVVVIPEVGNAAKIALHQHGLVSLPKFETPDMTTAAANTGASQRRHQIDLLKTIVGHNPAIADPP